MAQQTARQLGAVVVLLLAACGSEAPLPAKPVLTYDAPAATALRMTVDRTAVSAAGHRHSEFASAVDPRDPQHLLVGAIDWDDPMGLGACAAYVSRDGGRSWSGGSVYPTPGRALDDGGSQADPWVAIDDQGVAHFTCLTTAAGAHGIINYHRSFDGGALWTEPHIVAPRDLASHSVDRSNILPLGGGRLLFSTNEYNGDLSLDGLSVALSQDGGSTWTPTWDVVPSYAAPRGSAVGSDGYVYIGYVNGLCDGAESCTTTGVIASPDGGISWMAPTVVDLDPFAHTAGGSVAASPRSVAMVLGLPTTPAAILVSVDHARSFQYQALPAVPTTCGDCSTVLRETVAYNEDGLLGVELVIGNAPPQYESLAALAYTALTREVWLLASPDDGAHWLAPLRVAASTALAGSYLAPGNFITNYQGLMSNAEGVAARPSQNGVLYLAQAYATSSLVHMISGGDYEANLTTSGKDFVPLWIDASGGIAQVWSARVAVE